MKRIITNIFYIIIAISGMLQFFLMPGFIWNFTFPFLQILLILIALKSLKKSNCIKYCTLIIAILFLADIGFLIHSNLQTKQGDSEQEIKVMSYNLFFKNKRPEQSISIIKNVNPDIIFVQELTPEWASKIDENFVGVYTYKKTMPLKGTHGIGIYSKYEIANQEFLYNSSKKPYAQIVDLKLKGKTIQLINTHLASPAIAVENKEKFISLFLSNYQERKKQIKKLNSLASLENKKYDCQLLVGDLNTLYSEPIFKSLKFKWTNSSNSLSRWIRFNFPHSSKMKPIVSLDYIMGRGDMKFLESKVIEGGSSDHLAIMCKMKI